MNHTVPQPANDSRDDTLHPDDAPHPDDAQSETNDIELHIVSSSPVACNPATAVLAHPLVWMAAGTTVFFAAWTFPPGLYAHLFATSSAMHFDLKSFGFTMSCIAVLLAGIWCGLGGSFRTGPPRLLVGTDLDQTPWTGNGLLVLLTLGNLASCVIFIRAGGLGVIRAALQGQEALDRGMRDMIDESGGQLWLTAIVLSSVFAPAGYQMYRSMHRHPVTRPLFILFILTYVIAALLGSRRNYIARPLFGILLVWLVWPPVRQMTRRKALLAVAGAGVLMFFVFAGFSILRRGLDGTSDVLIDAARYLFTPYNTQSLIVHDVVRMPGAGTAYYWTEWLWHFPLISDVFELAELRAEFFGEKALTGFRERSPILVDQGIETGTAIPAFACSWVDLGWYGVLPFFIVGLVCASCWKGFLRGAAVSLILYPAIAYSFVEWRANLTFPSVMTSYALIVVGIIVVGRFLEAGRR